MLLLRLSDLETAAKAGKADCRDVETRGVQGLKLLPVLQSLSPRGLAWEPQAETCEDCGAGQLRIRAMSIGQLCR